MKPKTTVVAQSAFVLFVFLPVMMTILPTAQAQLTTDHVSDLDSGNGIPGEIALPTPPPSPLGPTNIAACGFVASAAPNNAYVVTAPLLTAADAAAESCITMDVNNATLFLAGFTYPGSATGLGYTDDRVISGTSIFPVHLQKVLKLTCFFVDSSKI